MKPRKWKRIATMSQFTLHQAPSEPQTFSVRFKTPAGHQKRVFQALNPERALAHAPYAAGILCARAPQDIPLADAFTQALKHARRSARATSDWRATVTRFARWLAKTYPACGAWHQLTRQILREYCDTLSARAPNTIRLAMQPIRQTAAYMRREHGFPDAAEGLATSSKLQRATPQVSLCDALDFLRYLRRRHPDLEAPATLQTLAGLQLQEATRLTWDRIDPRRGLIEISGEIKNEYRRRVIPLCEQARQTLERAQSPFPIPRSALRAPHSAIVHIAGPLVPQTPELYSRRLSRALRAWNPRLEWQPKDLRNAILQLGIREGALDNVWEQYVGHRPRTVTGIHYMYRLGAASPGQQKQLDDATAIFRQHVTDILDQHIERWKKENEKDEETAQAAN